MSHHKVKPGHKHDLFDEPWRPGATGPYGLPFARKVYSKLIPSIDVSINRENPHRKLPKSNVLVAGFDAKGTFDFVIPEGNTHGYWTLNKQLQNSTGLSGPEDHGGSAGDYVARTLIEYDLENAGITSGDEIEQAQLSLTIFKSKTLDDKYTFDFYRLHAGTTYGSIEAYAETSLTENATWYEYDHSGTGLSGVTSGEVVGRSFLATDGNTHGDNRWDSQGCGITGSTAEHLAVTAGETAALAWLDKSGGSTTANHDSQVHSSRDDNLYNYTLSLGSTQVITGKKINLDITGAVKDAVNNYVNKLRMVIQLRNDDSYNGTDSRGFISFYSSNFAKGDSALSQSKGSPAPTLSITWYDKSV
jgi:hypothetical protein